MASPGHLIRPAFDPNQSATNLDCGTPDYDYQALPEEAEKQVNARRVEDLKEFLGQCDIVTINTPLHDGTKGLINKEKLSWMKKGSWLVNTARGAIAVAEDVAEALNSGHLAGAGGDVWNVQPAPADHCWRSMKYPNGDGNGYVPHYSGTTLDAQTRYANGTKLIIENFLSGTAQNPTDVIVENGCVSLSLRFLLLLELTTSCNPFPQRLRDQR